MLRPPFRTSSSPRQAQVVVALLAEGGWVPLWSLIFVEEVWLNFFVGPTPHGPNKEIMSNKSGESDAWAFLLVPYASEEEEMMYDDGDDVEANTACLAGCHVCPKEGFLPMLHTSLLVDKDAKAPTCLEIQRALSRIAQEGWASARDETGRSPAGFVPSATAPTLGESIVTLLKAGGMVLLKVAKEEETAVGAWYDPDGSWIVRVARPWLSKWMFTSCASRKGFLDESETEHHGYLGRYYEIHVRYVQVPSCLTIFSKDPLCSEWIRFDDAVGLPSKCIVRGRLNPMYKGRVALYFNGALLNTEWIHLDQETGLDVEVRCVESKTLEDIRFQSTGVMEEVLCENLPRFRAWANTKILSTLLSCAAPNRTAPFERRTCVDRRKCFCPPTFFLWWPTDGSFPRTQCAPCLAGMSCAPRRFVKRRVRCTVPRRRRR